MRVSVVCVTCNFFFIQATQLICFKFPCTNGIYQRSSFNFATFWSISCRSYRKATTNTNKTNSIQNLHANHCLFHQHWRQHPPFLLCDQIDHHVDHLFLTSFKFFCSNTKSIIRSLPITLRRSNNLYSPEY